MLPQDSITHVEPTVVNMPELPDIEWTFDQHSGIVSALQRHGCVYLKGREEYTLLKEEVVSRNFTQDPKLRKVLVPKNPVISRADGSGVISPICDASRVNDTNPDVYKKPFLAPLDVQKSVSVADVIPSFKVIQSNSMSLCIGFDTEFQDYRECAHGAL